MRFAPGTHDRLKRAVLSTTERCCVVMQTLAGGVEIEVRHGLPDTSALPG